MTTLAEYRERLAMSRPEFARAANLDVQTVNRAEDGERINAKSARAIAEALSRLFGQDIQVRDIEGLKVRL